MMRFFTFISLIVLMSSLLRADAKKWYELSYEPIDVVFVCHAKDARTLDLAIKGITEHGKNIRRIIVVSAQKLTDSAEWFDEAYYPFTQEDLAVMIFNGDKVRADQFMHSPRTRMGWIYQQFLKLYAAFVIPDISSNVLIVDADTIFLRPVEFIDDSGCALFNPGTEYTEPYFEHGKRLIPGFAKIYAEYSGISHHMLFQRAILEDMFAVIRETHNMEPWQALCACIDVKDIYGSCLSEYELYFNFAFSRTDQVKLRFLQWNDIKFSQYGNYKNRADIDYVSCHTWRD